MKRFDVVDASKRGAAPCAVLEYDERRRRFDVVLAPGAGARDVPLMFVPFVKRGDSRLGPVWSKRWVEERIVPAGRQNLGQILRAHGLEEYDEYAFLLASQGRCSQDDFYLRPHEGAQERATSKLAQQAGERLRAARLDAGMTQADLARASGVHQTEVSRLERGIGNPTLKLLETLAQSLGRSWEMLLS